MAKKEEIRKPKAIGWKWNLICTLLILIVLYIGIHILVRTDGMRHYICERISKWTKEATTLASCQATPTLGLHMKGLSFSGVSIPDVKVYFNSRAIFRKNEPWIKKIVANEPVIKLQRLADTNQWHPVVLNNLSIKTGKLVSIPYNDLLPDQGEWIPKRLLNTLTIYQLNRAKISWFSQWDTELAYIADIDSQVRKVSFIDRSALQTLVRCGHLKMASKEILRDLELEVLKIENYDSSLILKMSDSRGKYDGFQTKDPWLDLNIRLKELAKLE